MSLKTVRNSILILALIIFSGGVGYHLGRNEIFVKWQNFKPQFWVVNKEPPPTKNIDFSLFWETWDRLSRDYIDKKALDPQKMVWGAISGMVSSLGDPYTVFLTPKQNKETKEELGGKFEGIGAQLGMRDKRIVVIAPLKGMPAEKAGIQAGDLILKVDGQDTTGWTLPFAVSQIRGPRGSKVVLTVLHEGKDLPAEKSGEPVDIEIIRDTIKVASVEWEEENVRCQRPDDLPAGSQARCQIISEDCDNCSKIAYLKLSRFGDETGKEWEKAVAEIRTAQIQGEIKGLVLDLRNNPGGYLSGAVFIASEFLKDGLIVTQELADGTKHNFSVARKGVLLDLPMVVLINKGSASASEIVAGALKVRGRAKLVGETSFGKGSIQEAQELPGGAGLHITTAKWLLPSGKSINGKGLEVDVKTEDDLQTEKIDEQLEKAAEVLLR